MGKQMKMMIVVCLMSLVVLGSAEAVNEITCAEGVRELMPCIGFLRGSGGPTPSSACCDGAGDVFRRADTTPVRRQLCKCLKSASAQFGVLPDRAKSLPQLCHFSLSFPIDPNVDCSTIPV